MLSKEQIAFVDKLYVDMYRKLFLYAMNIMKNTFHSEEAVQDTFRIACAKIDSFYTCQNPEGWLFNTLKYVLRNMQKSHMMLNKYIIMLFDIESVKDSISSNPLSTDFELIFGDIVNSDDFKLLLRIVIDKCTMLEASKEFGISIDVCKKRIQRIKKKLKNKLLMDM